MPRLKALSAALCLAAAAAASTGCAFDSFNFQNDQLRYAEVLPSGISFAFRQSNKVWLVAGKNTMVGSAQGLNGQTYSVNPDGSYFTVLNPPESFYITVDGTPQLVVVPLSKP